MPMGKKSGSMKDYPMTKNGRHEKLQRASETSMAKCDKSFPEAPHGDSSFPRMAKRDPAFGSDEGPAPTG